jgi:serine phosphatase RsbU (regulator of sigma subunit)
MVDGGPPPQEEPSVSLSDALDAMQDHVVIAIAVREDGRIVDFVLTYANRPFVDGAGRLGAEIVGKRVLDLYPAWVEQGMFDVFCAVVETRIAYNDERVHYVDRAPDGTVIEGWWSLRSVPFGDGYVASSRNVTDEVRAEQDRLAVRLEQERTRMAVDLLQRAALPAALPNVAGIDVGAGHRPAAQAQPVGGDWYDAFELDRGRLGVVIADVAGHGPDAAAYMVQVRNVVRALAFEHQEPATVLGQAASVIARMGTGDLFATCCYAVVDPADRSVTWARAGHLHPLVLADPTRVVEAAGGPPLGVDPAAAVPAIRLELGAGEGLLLCTDGLVERRDEPVERGMARLAADVDARRLAAPDLGTQALVDALIGSVDDPADDIAVLCVRFVP